MKKVSTNEPPTERTALVGSPSLVGPGIEAAAMAAGAALGAFARGLVAGAGGLGAPALLRGDGDGGHHHVATSEDWAKILEALAVAL